MGGGGGKSAAAAISLAHTAKIVNVKEVRATVLIWAGTLSE